MACVVLVLVLDTAAAEAISSGMGSWYGPRFQGRRMANGCPFYEERLTAASRDLPIGSFVRVTNQRNGLSIVVEITDRGPFIPGRVIDLSRAAARHLDMIGQGVVHVTIEKLSVSAAPNRRCD